MELILISTNVLKRNPGAS